MICDFCKRDLEGLITVEVLDTKVNLCEFDAFKVAQFCAASRDGIVQNILFMGGRIDCGSWEWIRDFLRKEGIHEVLELGGGLSTELFVNEGIKLVTFDVLDFHINIMKRLTTLLGKVDLHSYPDQTVPPVEALYPGRNWDFVFVDGPQRRMNEVEVAMRVSKKYIFLHDPNAGEETFFPNKMWERVGTSDKLFQRRPLLGHHMQMIEILKERFGEDPIRGMEIGTFYACLTKAILSQCQNVTQLWTVDPWEHREGTEFEATSRDQATFDEMRAHAIKALEEFTGRIGILNMTSDDAFTMLRDEQLDFIWIDGDHTHAQVEKDILNARRMVRTGGLLGGHDFATVRPVLDRLFKSGDLERGDDQTWWVKNHCST
jgi:hypothetical protein